LSINSIVQFFSFKFILPLVKNLTRSVLYLSSSYID